MDVRFIGCGNASSIELGDSSCVIEFNENKNLVIDFGPSVLDLYKQHYCR